MVTFKLYFLICLLVWKTLSLYLHLQGAIGILSLYGVRSPYVYIRLQEFNALYFLCECRTI